MDWSFLAPAGITLGFTLAAALFHYHKYAKRDIAFTVVIYSLLVFFIVYFVSFEDIGLGIGLLGILSLIRLRSTPENPIDIGYVFYSIAIGLLNASILMMDTLLVVNFILLLAIIFFASGLIFRKNSVKTTVTFDDVESEKLRDRDALVKRIEEKFGVVPIRVKVTKIDYLKDSMTVEFTYHARTH